MGHTDHHSACIQESNTDVQYIQENTQQTVEAVTGANWYPYIGPLGISIIDTEAETCGEILDW